MNNQGSKAAQKENEKSPESELEHMEISDAYDRAFMFSVPRILNELWENANRQFDTLRKINEQNTK